MIWFFLNSSIAKYPDFKLVPKDQETEFCRWNEIQDFVLSKDAEPKPKYIEIPPLLKLYLARNRRNFQEEVQDDDLLLPAYKIYEGEHRLEDRIEPNSISQYLNEQFATHKDFSVDDIPIDEWNNSIQKSRISYRAYLYRRENTKDYKKWKQRATE